MTNPALSTDQSVDAGERGVAAPPIEATEQLVLLRSSVAPKPQSRALPPEETISSDNETRLKQSEGRIALGSVLTKFPFGHLPPLNFRPRAWTS